MNSMKKLNTLLVLTLALLIGSLAAQAQGLYAPLGDSNQVAKLDPAGKSVLSLFGQMENPHGLAASPNGKVLYAASLLEKPVDGTMAKPEGVSEEDHAAHHGGASASPAKSNAPRTVSFITKVDAATGKILARIEVRNFTHHVEVTPDGRFVIGVQPSAGRIVVVDAKTDQVLQFIPTGAAPNYALASREGHRVYVSNAGTDTITVLDTTTWRVIANIPVAKAPEHMAFSADESRLYAVNTGSNELSLVDTGTLKEIKRVPTGQTPHGVAIGKDGRIIVSNQGEDTLSVYAPDGAVSRMVALSPQPYHVGIRSGDDTLWVTSRSQGKIWRLNTSGFSILGTLELPSVAHQLVFTN